jgi:hypothetical protein
MPLAPAAFDRCDHGFAIVRYWLTSGLGAFGPHTSSRSSGTAISHPAPAMRLGVVDIGRRPGRRSSDMGTPAACIPRMPPCACLACFDAALAFCFNRSMHGKHAHARDLRAAYWSCVHPHAGLVTCRHVCQSACMPCGRPTQLSRPLPCCLLCLHGLGRQGRVPSPETATCAPPSTQETAAWPWPWLAFTTRVSMYLVPLKKHANSGQSYTRRIGIS